MSGIRYFFSRCIIEKDSELDIFLLSGRQRERKYSNREKIDVFFYLCVLDRKMHFQRNCVCLIQERKKLERWNLENGHLTKIVDLQQSLYQIRQPTVCLSISV